MHAKSGLRVVLKWKIFRPDSVIADVIPPKLNGVWQLDFEFGQFLSWSDWLRSAAHAGYGLTPLACSNLEPSTIPIHGNDFKLA